MDMIGGSNKEMELPASADGLSRRNVLVTATVAAGALVGVPSALADTFPAASFGAPLVELHVPAGVLTLEQRSAMIKGITDVVLGATKQPPDPAKRLFVQIFETAEGGFGVNGQVFVPRKDSAN
jgi:phenylpyruvate tautomerase PptA (4-oxalocrotonate tautomerase family)